MNESEKNNKDGWKRTLIEWGIIGAVVAVLYLTGLHTVVLGTLQRAVLWTGIFDADVSKVETYDGPMLTENDFNFSMFTTSGKQISLDDFRGEIVFLNLWASWCPPCVAEMPTINTLQENVSDLENINFVLLSLDQEQEKAVAFMKNREFTLPYYFPASRIPEKLYSQYLPTTFVISKKGKIIYKKEGIANYSAPEFTQWLRNQAED